MCYFNVFEEVNEDIDSVFLLKKKNVWMKNELLLCVECLMVGILFLGFFFKLIYGEIVCVIFLVIYFFFI